MAASAAMTQVGPTMRAPDERWPTAAEWLAAGPGDRQPDLAVLGVPAFATSLTPSGAHATPAAVRRKLAQLTTWCGSRKADVSELAVWDRGDVDDPDVEIEGEWRVRTAAETAAAKSRMLIAIGGDRSITHPVLAGAFGAGVTSAGLVMLGAHHDIRDGRSNASVVRRLIEAGLDPERIVQLGVADWAESRSYGAEAHARGVTTISVNQIKHSDIDQCMREALSIARGGNGPVYVAIDLSVCDSSVVPGCARSLPGGLSARDAMHAAWIAGQDEAVEVIDITEVDVSRDPDERTVRLAAMCLLEAAAGLVAARP